MDLLKSKIDKNVKSSMIFPNANLIIAYNTNTFITYDNEIDIVIDVKDSINVKDIKDVKDSINVKDIKDSINVKDIKDKLITINNNITPLDFIKDYLQLYEDIETIKNKLFTFISNQKVINKYTKRGASLIMDGLSQDKWNINVCKLFSFLLDITFSYRKQIIKMI